MIALSHRIHAHPEIGFEEERAAAWVGESLDGDGFAVESGICGLPTAFLATAGSGPLHSSSAPSTTRCPASATPAATTSSPPPRSAPASLWPPSPTTSGSPCGSSARRPRRAAAARSCCSSGGAFDGVHAGDDDPPGADDIAEGRSSRPSSSDIRYTGKEAHASAFPELGINAADALTVAQVAIGLLRQHLRPTTGSTASSPTAARRPTSSRPTPRRAYIIRGADAGRPRDDAGHGDALLRGRRPGHRHRPST